MSAVRIVGPTLLFMFSSIVHGQAEHDHSQHRQPASRAEPAGEIASAHIAPDPPTHALHLTHHKYAR